MPTPSELLKNSRRRSIFGNYRADELTPLTPALSPSKGERENYSPSNRELVTADGRGGGKISSGCNSLFPFPEGEGQGEGERDTQTATTLQASIDTAIARSFIHRFLAKAFEGADPEGWQWMTNPQTKRSLSVALDASGFTHFAKCAASNLEWLDGFAFDSFATGYVTCFGHTVRGDCPMNEIEYGDIKADPLFQPHRLADLGAFFAGFGLEVSPDAAERVDHISIGLEFMSVLAAKEAYAIEHQFDVEQLDVLRDAQKKFLREHLGRWTPAFTRRLAKMAGDTPLGALAQLTGEFLKQECVRFDVPPGSEDLLLRPVDETMERLCDSCGLKSLLPGATSEPAEA